MKQMTKFLTLAIVMIAFSLNAFSQVSANATASARIIAPITIGKDVDLHFGTIYKGTAGGTVILTPAGARSVGSGDVTLSALAPVAAVASFTVGGEAGLTYSIAVAGAPLTITSGGNTMTVTAFTTSPTPTGTIQAGGTETLTVGATLNVGPNQASGLYTGGPFTVTVNYN
jgi:hypothetical protein